MSEKTNIAWANSTFNPVIGCTEVSPGCDNCYAREFAKAKFPVAESGPKRRPFDHAWLCSIVEQCKAAGVSCFVKQDSSLRPGARGKIPDDLWIREFP